MLTVMGVGGASGNAFVRGYIFGTSPAHLSSVNPATGKPSGSLVVLPNGQWAYGTLVLGSALALFGYPHAAPGLCAAKRRDVIRRNAAMLPACMLVLGLIVLFGYMARSVPATNADACPRLRARRPGRRQPVSR